MKQQSVNEVGITSGIPVSAIRQNSRCLILSLMLIAITAAWFISSYHGYAVKGLSTPKDEFSAERAIAALTEILGDQAPHPAGSDANFEVRQRLMAHMEAMELKVEQTQFDVKQSTMCNVLTSVPGDPKKRPVLLATHYDSVEQGPGAGDAGSCVAALLETARILNEQRLSLPDELLNRDVYFLFTDGEEWNREINYGLNGALQFAETQRHPLLDRQPILLNFDARGAAGPSLLYETSGNNLQLLKHVLPALPRRAFTASSYVTVYDLLPNATDFTIFKGNGVEGLNFAFIADPHRYHTPEDILENLDNRSVQHHGENALAVTRHLLDSDWQTFSDDQNAVFFTILDRWIVCYPESYAVLFAALLLIAQLIGTRISMRRGATIGQMIAASFATLLAVVVSILCGRLVMEFDRFRPQSYHGFGQHDSWIVAVLWLCAALSAIGMLRLFARSTSTESTWASVWLGTAIAGLIAAIYLPGFSYVMLTIGIVPALLSLLPGDKSRLSIVAIGVAGLFSIPLAYQFGIALGPKMAMVLSALNALFLVPIFPLLAIRHRS